MMSATLTILPATLWPIQKRPPAQGFLRACDNTHRTPSFGRALSFLRAARAVTCGSKPLGREDPERSG